MCDTGLVCPESFNTNLLSDNKTETILRKPLKIRPRNVVTNQKIFHWVYFLYNSPVLTFDPQLRI